MKKIRYLLKNIVLSSLIMLGVYYINVYLRHTLDIKRVVPMIYVLGVFLISVLTDGYLWGILASAVSVFIINYYFLRPYQEWIVLDSEAIILAFIVFVVAIITCTMTSKLKADQKIKSEAETERMRANLMRAAGHDLRTPLTAINASASAILENHDSMTVKQKLDLLKDIQQESDGLVRMVENILTVTRINNEGVKITKSPTVLEELVDSVIVKFQKIFPDIPIKVEIPDEFISIPMDVILIEQVLINFLENAADHAVGMTELILRVTLTDEEAVFEVSDNGCGIPKDRLDGIFEGYFSSIVKERNNERRNMGIGLSVCAAIIKAHDSEIYAHNNQSKGATFGFTLKKEREICPIININF